MARPSARDLITGYQTWHGWKNSTLNSNFCILHSSSGVHFWRGSWPKLHFTLFQNRLLFDISLASYRKSNLILKNYIKFLKSIRFSPYLHRLNLTLKMRIITKKKSVLKRLQLHEKLLDPCHSSVYCFCCQDVYMVQSLFLLI